MAERSHPIRRPGLAVHVGLCVSVAVAILLSLALGAVAIPAGRVLSILAGGTDPAWTQDILIVSAIRLPRTLLGLMVGAGLAVSGALMQGLFRNPLADPALTGVSAGSGLAAAAVIVLGDHARTTLGIPGPMPFVALPCGAFLGGLAAAFGLYRLATRQGRTSVATMLLAGIAMAALAGACTGLLIFVSDDRQLRDFTFWSFGSLSGATWTKVAVTAPALLPVLALTPFLGRGLNALVLGEAEAFHLGIAVERLKRLTILLVAVAIGAGVAAAGVIGFVGLVVPHGLRLVLGPDHRSLLPACALGGATLLVVADLVARVVAAPAELPIGLVTALIGAPVFLWMLLGPAAPSDG